MRIVYNVLLIPLLPLALLRLWWRSLKNKAYLERIPERFACYSKAYQAGGIVVHAVSVGETVAAIPLVNALQQRHPNLPITVTCMTPTGSARMQKEFGERVQHVYLPYDAPFLVKRFLKMFQPRLFIVMETEWWPNLFAQLKQHKIPLMVANARLSTRSLKRYGWIRSMAETMAESIDVLCAQTHEDAEHFKQLGVPANRIHVTGNIKVDQTLDPNVLEQAKQLRSTWGGRAVWIAASTHVGEEAAVTLALHAVKTTCPGALAIVVPRHPERFNGFYEMLKHSGLKVARRSLKEAVTPDTDVYYVDTMGELMMMYACADIAFVAGSLVPAGGHNMLEAALMKCAIIMGPNLQNVRTQAQTLQQAHAMVVVNDGDALARQIIDWIQHPEKRDAFVDNATAYLKENQGALDRTLLFVPLTS